MATLNSHGLESYETAWMPLDGVIQQWGISAQKQLAFLPFTPRARFFPLSREKRRQGNIAWPPRAA